MKDVSMSFVSNAIHKNLRKLPTVLTLDGRKENNVISTSLVWDLADHFFDRKTQPREWLQFLTDCSPNDWP